MHATDSSDPLLEELDEARSRISAKCDHDPEKVFEYFVEYQKRFTDRLISRHEGKPQGNSTAQQRRFMPVADLIPVISW